MSRDLESQRYFAKPGTVASWWDPLGEADEPFKKHSIAQQQDLLEKCPVAGKKILDCCTGRGRMAIAAAQHGAASVLGIDISGEMLEIARANATAANVAVEFMIGNAADLDLSDGIFDIVFCLEVLLHFDDPWRAIAEFHRILAPGGSVIITTNGANPLGRLFQPRRRGAHPAGRIALASVIALNEMMSACFGFMWHKTRPTGWLYSKIFRVPVRPLYRRQVARMLKRAGFSIELSDIKVGPFVREYRWIGHKLPSH